MFNKWNFYVVRKPRMDVLVTGGAFFGRQAQYYGKYCRPWTLISDQSPYVPDGCKPQLRSASRKLHRFAALYTRVCVRGSMCMWPSARTILGYLQNGRVHPLRGARPRASPALSILVYREFLKALATAMRLHFARGKTTGKRTGKEIRPFLARFLCVRGEGEGSAGETRENGGNLRRSIWTFRFIYLPSSVIISG